MLELFKENFDRIVLRVRSLNNAKDRLKKNEFQLNCV